MVTLTSFLSGRDYFFFFNESKSNLNYRLNRHISLDFITMVEIILEVFKIVFGTGENFEENMFYACEFVPFLGSTHNCFMLGFR